MQRDLVIRAQAGDLDAFSALTAGLTVRLYKTARLILRNDDRAADAVQDALLQAWLDLRGLRDADRFDAWLHRLLVRACYLAAKRQRIRDVVEIQLSPDVGPDVSDVQRSTALHDQLARGFMRLSVDQRVVIVLHHYLGLSLLETADIVGVPLGTAQSRINRAALRMRAALEADDRSTELAEGVAQ